MAYYISFLKTLSFKLNTHTIHFFFNEHTNDFSLYTEAIKFFNHSEKMVRIAVRTLTLNVFRVQEPSMLKFITDHTAVPYFSNLVWFIGNHVLDIDNCLHGHEKTQQMVVRLDDLVAEHLDHLHYLNDILLLNIPDLNAILTEHLLNRLLVPLYIYSLVEDERTILRRNVRRGRMEIDDETDPGPSNMDREVSLNGDEERIRISRLVSLFLLSQVFLIVSYEPLVQELLNIVQNGSMSLFNNPSFSPPSETLEESLIQVQNKSLSGSPSCSREEYDDEDGTKSQSSNSNSRRPSMLSARQQETSSTEASQQEAMMEETVPGSSINNTKAINRVNKNANKSSSQSMEQQSPSSSSTQLLPATNISEASITDEEKAAAVTLVKRLSMSKPSDKPFLQVLFQCLDCSDTKDDHTFIFALCLIYAIVHNRGMLLMCYFSMKMSTNTVTCLLRHLPVTTVLSSTTVIEGTHIEPSLFFLFLLCYPYLEMNDT